MPADRIDRTRRCPGLTRRRRTVAVVTPYFTPMIGGVENYTERVAKEVHSTPDLRAVVITSNHEGSATLVEEHDGIPVVRLGTWLKASNTPLNPWWPVAIRRLLNRYDVDLVNVHAPVPYLADVTTMVAGRRPVVMTYHSGSLVKNTGRVDGLLRLYERHVLPRVFARATELVAVTPDPSGRGHHPLQAGDPSACARRRTHRALRGTDGQDIGLERSRRPRRCLCGTTDGHPHGAAGTRREG
jgi:hypothetical protein